MTKKITPDDAKFWTERAIDFYVRHARPYQRYRVDDDTPVKDAYALLKTAGQKAKMVAWAHQADGILINRHAALPGLPPVFPEMRPDTAIRTGQQTRHWHGYGDPPEDDRWYQRLDPDTAAGEAHRRKHHAGGNTEEVHLHDDLAKYTFPPAPTRKKKPQVHTHDKSYPVSANRPKRDKYSNVMEAEERRRRHVNKHHGGVDVAEPHPHEWTDKDHATHLARRLDVHPLAAPLFDDAKLVYFILEGCLKSDAALSAILREGRPEAVFSVPSVSLWLAEELPEFVERKLRGKQVVVVPDADWYTKAEVIEQARLCFMYLARRGIAAHVAAPPHDGPNKGLDDHLGAGHSLDDLVVQDRQVDAWGQRAWLNHRGLRKDGKDRAADMLYCLGYAGVDGEFTGSLSRFARTMDIARRRVGRGVHDLEKLGAITINGDLSIRRDWFSKALRWEDPPTITLIPELRGKDGPEYRLGELPR